MQTMDAERITEALLALAPHWTPSRHTSGRIELKFRLSGMNLALNSNWEDLIESIPGILDTRLQLLSKRIVIDYDPTILPPDLWEEIARLQEDPEAAAQVKKRLQAISKPASA